MSPTDDLTDDETEAITTGLVRLAKQIDRARHPEDIAGLLRPVLDPHDGALHRIGQIFEATSRTCDDFTDHDPYARDLGGISDDAADAVHELGRFLCGFGEQFRTFAPDVTRTPSNERPPAPGTRPAAGG
ncbi:hypothetical protein [Streptomyces sp. NPDC056244]|uniref:hypothetical protein n=1 Tax=Streptomyces sp. NPDC056244 TaxID=3345762 RepID=UPI0035E11093